MQWVPDESEAAITSATYSSDGEIICVGFRSESIKILDSMTFLIKCRINLTAFTQPIPSNIRYTFLTCPTFLIFDTKNGQK